MSPKRAATFELMLPPRPAGADAYRWLYAALRAAILDGTLAPGARLPGTRDLAAQYGLSRGTIVAAFELLRVEGYAAGAVGSGTYVSRVLPARQATAQRRAGRPAPPRRLSAFGARVHLLPNLDERPVRAFRANVPAVDLFPARQWAQITARRMRHAPAGQLLGCGPLGWPPLRVAIAEYLRTSRGVACEDGQVVVLTGVQEALDLVARLFLEPGDRVCMEDPGYVGAARAFEAAGARIAPAPLDGEGMTLHRPALKDARLVYVTPAHQFPVGVTMSLPRRLALLDWARRADALVIEDDYDSEFRYAGRPVPAMQGLDRSGRVLFMGTFSKTLFPALRLGFLVVPSDLVGVVAAARSIGPVHAPVLEQAVLADFIAGGHYGRHLRRMRDVYGARLAALLDLARAQLGGRLEVSSVEAGLQTAAWLGNGVSGEAVARAAAERSLEVIPLSRYARRPLARDGLHLGFAALPEAELERGVRELAAVLGA